MMWGFTASDGTSVQAESKPTLQLVTELFNLIYQETYDNTSYEFTVRPVAKSSTDALIDRPEVT